jgi:hypothetical protein
VTEKPLRNVEKVLKECPAGGGKMPGTKAGKPPKSLYLRQAYGPTRESPRKIPDFPRKIPDEKIFEGMREYCRRFRDPSF